MPPIPVVAPTIVRVTMNHNMGNGRNADVILDMSVDEGSGADRATVAAAVAVQVGKQYQQKLGPLIWGPVAITGGTWHDLDSLDSASGIFGPFPGAPVNAGTGSSPVAPQVALICQKLCGHKRSQRNGRFFLPGPPDGGVDPDGQVQSTWAATVQDALDLLFVQLQDGTTLVPETTTALRVVHVEGHEASTVPGKPGRPNAWSSSDVTKLLLDHRCGTQRRRNRK